MHPLVHLVTSACGLMNEQPTVRVRVRVHLDGFCQKEKSKHFLKQHARKDSIFDIDLAPEYACLLYTSPSPRD